jgi:hypothetical protein
MYKFSNIIKINYQQISHMLTQDLITHSEKKENARSFIIA